MCRCAYGQTHPHSLQNCRQRSDAVPCESRDHSPAFTLTSSSHVNVLCTGYLGGEAGSRWDGAGALRPLTDTSSFASSYPPPPPRRCRTGGAQLLGRCTVGAERVLCGCSTGEAQMSHRCSAGARWVLHGCSVGAPRGRLRCRTAAARRLPRCSTRLRPGCHVPRRHREPQGCVHGQEPPHSPSREGPLFSSPGSTFLPKFSNFCPYACWELYRSTRPSEKASGVTKGADLVT